MQALNFDSTVSSFLNHLTIERGLSSNTLAAYKRDLRKFGEFLDGADLEKVTPEAIVKFQSALKESGLSVTSINRIDSTVRSFFKHALSEYGLPNPTLEMLPSSAKRRLPKALSYESIISMINAAYREGEPVTLRDQTMMELLYSSGARVSELIGINVGDLNIVESDEGPITTLKLRGKGSKERIVPLGSFATKAIDDYVVRVRPGLAAKTSKTNAALFLNSRGGRITRQSAWNMVKWLIPITE